MKVQVLRGFRDYLPAEMMAKSRMLEQVMRVFESFGYPPIQTPALEYSEVLVGKYGEEGDLLMYRFRDKGDRDVCMRYDLTVPLARVMAEHGNLPMPFRRYQIAPVWRAEKPGRGRYREFLQCDVDLVGVDDVTADVEMILVGKGVLGSLGVSDYALRINHRGVLRGLTRTLGIEDGERETAFLRLLDKLDKIGKEKFTATVEEQFALAGACLDRLLTFIRSGRSGGPPEAVLDAVADVVAGDRAGREGVERLRAAVVLLGEAGERGGVVIDPSIVRGLTYYTGIIYETTLGALPEFGSVMGGGRYDDLIGMFSGRELPAVGISLGVDRLFAALRELDATPLAGSPAQVLVTQFGEEGAGRALSLAQKLRSAGIACLVYPAAAKLGKQLQHADTLGVPHVAIVGDDEAAAGTVTLKELATGEQRTLPVAAAMEQLRARAREQAAGGQAAGGQP